MLTRDPVMQRAVHHRCPHLASSPSTRRRPASSPTKPRAPPHLLRRCGHDGGGDRELGRHGDPAPHRCRRPIRDSQLRRKEPGGPSFQRQAFTKGMSHDEAVAAQKTRKSGSPPKGEAGDVCAVMSLGWRHCTRRLP
ncbi:uncharacterized protein LOC125523162 [Triticum urartu]|uniref:uncharacterized protein LOC125523162 n=1 Tax=Triticum urartu TaxID=4572 RepID=UPI0020432718|nr:uncharacterized protein LOC125523162 [Triticum urartu]